MFGLTLKAFMQHAALPGFRQRFADLFASGFLYVPYFIALVYSSVRLLPPNHPYLDPSNMGRFGLWSCFYLALLVRAEEEFCTISFLSVEENFAWGKMLGTNAWQQRHVVDAARCHLYDGQQRQNDHQHVLIVHFQQRFFCTVSKLAKEELQQWEVSWLIHSCHNDIFW